MRHLWHKKGVIIFNYQYVFHICFQIAFDRKRELFVHLLYFLPCIRYNLIFISNLWSHRKVLTCASFWLCFRFGIGIMCDFERKTLGEMCVLHTILDARRDQCTNCHLVLMLLEYWEHNALSISINLRFFFSLTVSFFNEVRI